jgi:hypothetical protein
MATFAEIEDYRDWMVDTCGELLKKADALNGDEPEQTMVKFNDCIEAMHAKGLDAIKWLDELLVQKKRVE